MQDYQSLPVAGMICVTLVDTQTHTHSQTAVCVESNSHQMLVYQLYPNVRKCISRIQGLPPQQVRPQTCLFSGGFTRQVRLGLQYKKVSQAAKYQAFQNINVFYKNCPKMTGRQRYLSYEQGSKVRKQYTTARLCKKTGVWCPDYNTSSCRHEACD